MPKAAIGIFLLLALLPDLHAEAPEIRAEADLDWERGVLHIGVAVDIDELGAPTQARAKAAELFSRRIGSIFCDALADVQLDSHRTVKAATLNDPDVLADLLRYGSQRQPLQIHMNTDLSVVTAIYEIAVFPEIMSFFVTHIRSYEPQRLLQYVPSADYSGIVIYAKGGYPVHGEAPGDANLKMLTPSLRPRIYDTNMRLIAEAEMIDPDAMIEWGITGFSSESDYLSYKHRVGAKPLLTMARELFGDRHTDVVIPAETADRLLASEHNRDLIRRGRILIIFGP